MQQGHSGNTITSDAVDRNVRALATPLDLYRALRQIWSADTASPTGAWIATNPALNHCSITSLVVQDHFGGDLLKTSTVGGTHFYNMIDGKKWDLTVSQFAEPIPYDDVPASRDDAMGDCSRAKYDLFADRVAKALSSSIV